MDMLFGHNLMGGWNESGDTATSDKSQAQPSQVPEEKEQPLDETQGQTQGEKLVEDALSPSAATLGGVSRLGSHRIKRSSSLMGETKPEKVVLVNALTTGTDIRNFYDRHPVLDKEKEKEKAPAIQLPGSGLLGSKKSLRPQVPVRQLSQRPMAQPERPPSRGPIPLQQSASHIPQSPLHSQDTSTFVPYSSPQSPLAYPSPQQPMPSPLSPSRVTTTSGLNHGGSQAPVVQLPGTNHVNTTSALQGSSRSVLESQEYIRRRLESSQVTRFVEEKDIELNSTALLRANQAMEMVALLERKLEAQSKRDAQRMAKEGNGVPMANGKESPVSPVTMMSDEEKEKKDDVFLMAAQVATTHEQMENFKEWRAGVDAALSDLRTQFAEARQQTEARLQKLETETLGVSAAFHKVEAKVRAVQLSQDQSIDSLKESLEKQSKAVEDRLERLESHVFPEGSNMGDRSARGSARLSLMNASPRAQGVIRATVVKPAPQQTALTSQISLPPQATEVVAQQPQPQQPPMPQPMQPQQGASLEQTVQTATEVVAQQPQPQQPPMPQPMQPQQGASLEQTVQTAQQPQPQQPSMPQPMQPQQAASAQQTVQQPLFQATQHHQYQQPPPPPTPASNCSYQPAPIQPQQPPMAMASLSKTMPAPQGVASLQQQLAQQLQQQLLLTSSQLPMAQTQPTPQASHMEAYPLAIQQHQEQQAQQLQQQLAEQLERLQHYQMVQQQAQQQQMSKTQVSSSSFSAQAFAPQPHVQTQPQAQTQPQVVPAASCESQGVLTNGINTMPAAAPLVASPIATAVVRGRAGFPGDRQPRR